MTEFVLTLLALLILVRGLWGFGCFVSGRGAKYYNFRLSESTRHDLTWFQEYVLWKSTLLWVGTKNNPNNSERVYLLVLSTSQIVAGIILLTSDLVR